MSSLLNTVQQETIAQKYLETVSEKRSKKIVISLFLVLNNGGILRYAVKISTFQNSFFLNFFIRFDNIAFKGTSTVPSNIYDGAFCKIVQRFSSR